MAKFAFKGLDEFTQQIAALEHDSEELAETAVVAGAGVLADSIRNGIAGIPLRTSDEWGSVSAPVTGITKAQKKGLYDGLGIAPIRNNEGYIETKIGFDGYNIVKTKTHPKGQPNQLVARGVESGTSWMNKAPFISKATKASNEKVLIAMENAVNTKIKKIIK